MTRGAISSFHRLASWVVACSLLTACMVGPDYKRPELGLRSGLVSAPPANDADATVDLTRWWTGFGDPEMTSLVDRALTGNLDLAQARARVSQSRAAARAAGAALLPRASAEGSVDNVEQSLDSPIGEIGRHLPGFPRGYDDHALGAEASWELDLFGGLRRGAEAARADALASGKEAQAARTTVAAETADAYLQVRAYQARIDVADRQARVEKDLVALLTRLSKEGVAPERERHQAAAALDAVLASIPPLIAGRNGELNRLDVLIGAQPGALRDELKADAAIPTPPPVGAADGTPGLLRRRPDILAAEQRLIAANARIGEAVSDYYPRVSISGLVGVDSIDASQVFTGEAVQHQVGAGLRWRLFDFGRVDAEVAAARGRAAEVLAAYRATVLRATEEVENAFDERAREAAREAALTRQLAELTRARAQAEQAFEGGVISLIEVRDIDRDLLTASDQLTLARAGVARATISCFRALGGGWRSTATPTS
jgi:NodT family efflux transporter outer membrane factor (OMF) lipoprotein